MNVDKDELFKPLSPMDLNNIIGEKLHVVALAETSNMTSLHQVFQGHNHAIIFSAVSSPTFGHYSLLYKNRQNQIHFFDSYGMSPCGIVDMLRKANKPLFGQNNNLDKLLLKEFHNHVDIFYNPTKYQQEETQVCGKYVLLNLVLRFIYEKKNGIPYNGAIFKKLMIYWKGKYKKSFDEIVAYLIEDDIE